MDSTSLEGRIAFVTGGGQGLGEAICRRLAREGAVIVAADLNGEAAGAVAGSIRGDGGQAEGLAVDMRDASGVARALHEVAERHGRLDVLINNAGTDMTAPLEEIPVEAWDNILAVNLRGPFVATQAAFPLMRRQGSGHVVNIISTAAKRAWANASAYHASKWGLLGLSHALHVEGRECGIKVTAVVSGGMRTPFLLDRFPDLDPGVLQDPANVAETVRFVLCQPAETVIPEIMVLPMRETSWP
jgi:NAD(P)-dependent dehydrogenase (short-subunit alcohol dehydrogenase family)